ncbi:MAG TPA: hypothetical protein VGL53_16835 [Bryobacteraceae bacterium]|jgi:hypothetical protein
MLKPAFIATIVLGATAVAGALMVQFDGKNVRPQTSYAAMCCGDPPPCPPLCPPMMPPMGPPPPPPANVN